VSGALRDGLDEFAAIIWVAIAIAVVLILLIAFNSTAINADERAREHATMFAYGLPVARSSRGRRSRLGWMVDLGSRR
jgi:putative ABC transport system permease protein